MSVFLLTWIDFIKNRVYNGINNVVNTVEIGVILIIDVNELLEEAIKETEDLNDREVFLVKDFFKGYVWNIIADKDRLLGTLFLNYVNKSIGSLVAVEKTSSHQQRYKKLNNTNSSSQN